MRISLTDRYTDETFILEAEINARAGYSHRGPWCLVLCNNPGREITWDHWQQASGKVIYGDETETSRFKRWEQYGQDLEAKNLKERMKQA